MSSLRSHPLPQAAPSLGALISTHLPSEHTWLSWGAPVRWPLPRDCFFCCPSLNYYLFSASFTLFHDFLDVSTCQLFQKKKIWRTTKSCLYSMASLPSLTSGMGIFICMERYFGPAEVGSLQHIPEPQTELRLTWFKWQSFHPLMLGNAAKVLWILLLGHFSY